jgi:hypothetical protein
MPKSLAELRKSPQAGPPQRTHFICVAGQLQAELDVLDRELANAQADEDFGGSARRMTDKSKAVEIAAAADKIRAQMEDETAKVLFRAKSRGEWRQWCMENPARDGERRDNVTMAGICNADALVDTLGEYVAKINDDDPANGDWEFVATNAAPAALDAAARVVLEMHETVVDAGKSRRAWLSAQRSANSSE